MYKQFIFIYLAILFVCPQNYHDFDIYQEAVTRQQVEQRLQVLQNSPTIENHYHISQESIKIYASLENKKQNHHEYELKFAKQASPSMRKSLKSMRIAIDPGHIGGSTYCFLESRYILMNPKAVGGKENIHFHEGELALFTALHLKERLEKNGATVMLTRDRLGQSIYKKDFFSWLHSDFRNAVEDYVQQIDDLEERARQRSWWLTRSDLWSLFRKFYNPLDLKARAKKINDFGADITIVIHYNVGAGNNSDGQNIGCKENYNLAFVPGSFLKGELTTKIARYHFLRLLTTNDLNSSVDLSKRVVEKFVEKLNVPALEDANKADYLHKYCLPTTAPGVYARNLTLTRLVHGTICYGESLYQDNIEEALRLAKKDDVIAGVKISHRVRQVANAYFEAIVAYCK